MVSAQCLLQRRGVNNSMYFLCKVLMKKKRKYRSIFSFLPTISQPYVFYFQPKVYFQISLAHCLCSCVGQFSLLREKFYFVTTDCTLPQANHLSNGLGWKKLEVDNFASTCLRVHVFFLVAHWNCLFFWAIFFPALGSGETGTLSLFLHSMILGK